MSEESRQAVDDALRERESALPEHARLNLAEDNGRIKERLRVLDLIDLLRDASPDDAQILTYLREAVVND